MMQRKLGRLVTAPHRMLARPVPAVRPPVAAFWHAGALKLLQDQCVHSLQMASASILS